MASREKDQVNRLVASRLLLLPILEELLECSGHPKKLQAWAKRYASSLKQIGPLSSFLAVALFGQQVSIASQGIWKRFLGKKHTCIIGRETIFIDGVLVLDSAKSEQVIFFQNLAAQFQQDSQGLSDDLAEGDKEKFGVVSLEKMQENHRSMSKGKFNLLAKRVRDGIKEALQQANVQIANDEIVETVKLPKEKWAGYRINPGSCIVCYIGDLEF